MLSKEERYRIKNAESAREYRRKSKLKKKFLLNFYKTIQKANPESTYLISQIIFNKLDEHLLDLNSFLKEIRKFS